MDADALAKEAYSQAPLSSPKAFILPSSPTMLLIDEIAVSNTYNKNLIYTHLQNQFILGRCTIYLNGATQSV